MTPVAAKTTKLEYRDGKVVKRKVRLSDVREAKVFIEDHHDGYIDLGTFDENQIIIKSNCLSQTQVDRRGAARNGQGLLSGILRCGRCGRKLYVVYYGKSGTAARPGTYVKEIMNQEVSIVLHLAVVQ